MFYKTYKLNISKSDGSFSDTVKFMIPQNEGTYKLEFELSNGNKVDAGNIIVSNVERVYKVDFQMSDGTKIEGGTFSTPVVRSWHTVWEGAQRITPVRVTAESTPSEEGYPFSYEKLFEGIQSNITTRITFIPENEETMVKVITAEETSIYNVLTDAVKWTLYSLVDGENIKFRLRGFSKLGGRVLIKDIQLVKVEQYY